MREHRVKQQPHDFCTISEKFINRLSFRYWWRSNRNQLWGRNHKNVLISYCSLVCAGKARCGFLYSCGTEDDNKDPKDMTWWDVTLKTENGTIKILMLHNKSGGEAKVSKYNCWQNNVNNRMRKIKNTLDVKNELNVRAIKTEMTQFSFYLKCKITINMVLKYFSSTIQWRIIMLLTQMKIDTVKL